ncbi:unnamed protein product [Linum trigynum]|uniref:Uncharacterized protein n=1 Tax=Linum trigynum TaxID=586398 RepID=A0AAV2G7Y2_9ROSI
MQEEHIEEIAWKLSLHIVLDEEREKARRKVMEEEVSIKEEEDLDCSKGEEQKEVEGREVVEEVEGASGVQYEDQAVVDEASTSYKSYKSFPPDLDALLEKDPFAALCQAKAKPSAFPLGGCNGSQSMMD